MGNGNRPRNCASFFGLICDALVVVVVLLLLLFFVDADDADVDVDDDVRDMVKMPCTICAACATRSG